MSVEDKRFADFSFGHPADFDFSEVSVCRDQSIMNPDRFAEAVAASDAYFESLARRKPELDRIVRMLRDRSCSFDKYLPNGCVEKNGVDLPSYVTMLCEYMREIRSDYRDLYEVWSPGACVFMSGVAQEQMRVCSHQAARLGHDYIACIEHVDLATTLDYFETYKGDIAEILYASLPWFEAPWLDDTISGVYDFSWNRMMGKPSDRFLELADYVARAECAPVEWQAQMARALAKPSGEKLLSDIENWASATLDYARSDVNYRDALSEISFDSLRDEVEASGGRWTVVEQRALMENFRTEWSNVYDDEEKREAMVERGIRFYRSHRSKGPSSDFLPDSWPDWLGEQYAERVRSRLGLSREEYRLGISDKRKGLRVARPVPMRSARSAHDDFGFEG